jgi:tellurite resistance protein TerC
MTAPLWAWGAFTVFVLLMLALDLFVVHREAHEVSFKEAGLWSAVWAVLALCFGAGVWFFMGADSAEEFVTGWLIEKSLSLDNVFLFVVVFSALGVARDQRHRVLFWGVMGALVLRGAMIAGGAKLLDRFEWMIFVFGGLLIVTGARMMKKDEGGPSLERGPLAWLQRRLPMAKNPPPGAFTTVEDGARKATPLLLALIFIELADVVFAVDSIPAIFAVTRDPFLVFTSNVFAILGLRSLYFLLEGASVKLRHLKPGLAIVLLFVGAKMVASPWVHLPPAVSLVIVVGILGVSALLSWRELRQAAAEIKRPAAKVAAAASAPMAQDSRPERSQGRPVMTVLAAPAAKSDTKVKPTATGYAAEPESGKA